MVLVWSIFIRKETWVCMVLAGLGVYFSDQTAGSELYRPYEPWCSMWLRWGSLRQLEYARQRKALNLEWPRWGLNPSMQGCNDLTAMRCWSTLAVLVCMLHLLFHTSPATSCFMDETPGLHELKRIPGYEHTAQDRDERSGPAQNSTVLGLSTSRWGYSYPSPEALQTSMRY